MMIPAKTIEWELLHQIARSYLDLQKTRVAMELRSQKMIEQYLLKIGLAKEEFTNMDEDDNNNNNDENGNNNKKGKGRKIVMIESTDKDEQAKIEERIDEETTRFKESSDAY